MQENKSLFEHFEEIGRTISPKVQENKMYKKLTRFFFKKSSYFLSVGTFLRLEKNASVCSGYHQRSMRVQILIMKF